MEINLRKKRRFLSPSNVITTQTQSFVRTNRVLTRTAYFSCVPFTATRR